MKVLQVLLFCVVSFVFAQTRNSKPCHPLLTVDITNGTKIGKDILHDNITYTPKDFYIDKNKILGCLCNVKQCIRKCCPYGEGHNGTTCVSSSHPLATNFSIHTYMRKDKMDKPTEFKHVIGRDCSLDAYVLVLDTLNYEEDEHYLQHNGSLYMPNHDETVSDYRQQHEFCVDVNTSSDKNEYITLVCWNSPSMDIDETCTTPNEEKAICKPLSQCQVFVEALKIYERSRQPLLTQFMSESQCGYNDEPIVCCGNVTHYYQNFTPSTVDPRKHRNFHLLPINCGIQNVDERIPGGIETQLEEFPWLALLEFINQTLYGCSATLISDQYLLTAAHCVTGDILKLVGTPFRVRLGDHDLNTEIDCRRTYEGNQQYNLCISDYQDAEIDWTLPHHKFKADQSLNDIALIRLKERITITGNIRPICLPVNGEASQPKQKIYAAGWGGTTTSRTSNVKLKISLPVVSNQECTKIYNKFRRVIIHKQLCTGGELGLDTCSRDIGGPIMWPIVGSVPPQWIVEAIISYGEYPCGREGVPGVNTRVSSYIHWILDNIK